MTATLTKRRLRQDGAQKRIERLAASPAAASTKAGQGVVHLDGRTRIIGMKHGSTWTPVPRGMRLDRPTVKRLFENRVAAILCRRGFRVARVTVSWLR